MKFYLSFGEKKGSLGIIIIFLMGYEVYFIVQVRQYKSN